MFAEYDNNNQDINNNQETINKQEIINDLQNISIINQNYGDANDYYKDIKNSLVYNEMKYDNLSLNDLIPVGAICNDEYSSYSFNADRYWDKDTGVNIVRNSFKIMNDNEWQEQTKLHNGTITAKPGLVILNKSSNGYIVDDVNFFSNLNADASNITNDINVYAGSNGVAMDIFGYFHPDATGPWTFTIPGSDAASGTYTYLWISNDYALLDYTVKNADINSTSTQMQNKVSITKTLSKDDYVPFRIQIISKTINFSTGQIKPFTITPPSENSNSPNPLFKNPNQGWDYFVTFIKGNEIYYKNNLYVGFVVDSDNPNGGNSFFINPSDIQNKTTILKCKQNQELQYLKIEVPTPITFAGKGTIKNADGIPTNITLPDGIDIKIISATYGSDTDYVYNTYKDVQVTKDVWVAPTTTTTTITNKNPNLLQGQNVVNNQQGYYKPTTTTVTQTIENRETQKKDVTQQIQDLINANTKININGSKRRVYLNLDGNYTSIFGDPIKDKNNKNITRYLSINYSYTANPDAVEGKNIYLDPATGLITIGYIFSDFPGTTVLKMDVASSCTNQKCTNYKMVLTDDGKLSVMNESNSTLGYINLTKFTTKLDPNFNIKNCQKNLSWLQDPNVPNMLTAGTQLSSLTGNKLISADGRFKLDFENNKFIFTYCYKPYICESNVCYSSTFNVAQTNNSQIYYLYRMKTRGLYGRRFLFETSSSKKTTDIHYLPNNSNNVYYPSGYDLIAGGTSSYPLALNKSFIDASNKLNTKYSIYSSTNSDVKNADDCGKKCNADPNSRCEHYFFMNNSDGTSTCYADSVGDANPTYTNINSNPSVISNSKLYKKKYILKTTCNGFKDEQPLSYLSNSKANMSAYTVDFTPGENRPNYTYYCGLERYRQANDGVINTYTKMGTESMQNISTSYREGLESATQDTNSTNDATIPSTPTPPPPTYNTYATTMDRLIMNKFPSLNYHAKQYSKTQDQIGETYQQTLYKMKDYLNTYDSLKANKYNFNGTDSVIPEQYKNNPSPQPSITLEDGLKRDTGVMLLQQNTMYTLASMTAATFLVLAIFFGSE